MDMDYKCSNYMELHHAVKTVKYRRVGEGKCEGGGEWKGVTSPRTGLNKYSSIDMNR